MRLALLFIGYYGSFEFSTGKMKATKKNEQQNRLLFSFHFNSRFPSSFSIVAFEML